MLEMNNEGLGAGRLHDCVPLKLDIYLYFIFIPHF